MFLFCSACCSVSLKRQQLFLRAGEAHWSGTALSIALVPFFSDMLQVRNVRTHKKVAFRCCIFFVFFFVILMFYRKIDSTWPPRLQHKEISNSAPQSKCKNTFSVSQFTESRFPFAGCKTLVPSLCRCEVQMLLVVRPGLCVLQCGTCNFLNWLYFI